MNARLAVTLDAQAMFAWPSVRVIVGETPIGIVGAPSLLGGVQVVLVL